MENLKSEIVSKPERNDSKSVDRIREEVRLNAERISTLGNWPEYIPADSILERIPTEENRNAPGLDAGIACCLGLIPNDRQKLAATLHASYRPEAVMQVREEIQNLLYGSETFWWLLACSVCEEGGIDEKKFLEQIENFKSLSANEELALSTAKGEYEKMISRFGFNEEIGGDVPYGEIDGCMQGAYLKGYSYAVSYSEAFGIYFIGTFLPSLGLEDFAWSVEKDESGRPKSGPVWGSKQFVKCKDKEELKKALEAVKEHLNK